MKTDKILEKYKVLLGSVLFGVAYLPTVSQFVSCNTSSPLMLSETNASTNTNTAEAVDWGLDNVSSAVFNSYSQNSNLLSMTSNENSDFVDSIGEFSPDSDSSLVNDADNVALVEADVSTIDKTKTSVIQKIKEKVFVSPKKSVKIPGYGEATFVKGEIKSNFYVDARKLGIPVKAVDAMIKNLSGKLNFKHSLQRGDKFEIIYNAKNEMIYGKIITKRSNVAVYKFTKDNSSGYYFANGDKCEQSAKKSGFGQPLAGKLKISDPFGWRRHPITGRFHNHSGVDLRAHYGTPVHAIYDGVVTRASFYSGYGRCVDLKHIGGYSSRYAHLSRFAVRIGSKVKKGQIIGYVGSSGVSTGAHLHLELAKNSRVMNPLSIKMMPTQKATVPNLAQFNMLKRRIDNIARKA